MTIEQAIRVLEDCATIAEGTNFAQVYRMGAEALHAQRPTVTNADRVRAMSDDELDQFIRGVFDMGQAQATIRQLGNATDMFEWGLDWLQRPVEGKQE